MSIIVINNRTSPHDKHDPYVSEVLDDVPDMVCLGPKSSSFNTQKHDIPRLSQRFSRRHPRHAMFDQSLFSTQKHDILSQRFSWWRPRHGLTKVFLAHKNLWHDILSQRFSRRRPTKVFLAHKNTTFCLRGSLDDVPDMVWPKSF